MKHHHYAAKSDWKSYITLPFISIFGERIQDKHGKHIFDWNDTPDFDFISAIVHKLNGDKGFITKDHEWTWGDKGVYCDDKLLLVWKAEDIPEKRAVQPSSSYNSYFKFLEL